MRKCGKFLLIAILAIVLVATLAACNFGESSQSGQQGGGVNPGGDPVVEQAVPYDLELRALKGSSAFAKAVASEFDISRDVEAYIRLKQGNALIRGEKITLSLENVVDEDRAKLGGAFDGYITVEYTHQDKALSGKFELHLLADTADRVAVNIDIGDGARLTGGDAKKTDVPGVWSVSLPLNEQYYYEDFVGTYKLFAPEGKALSHYTYDSGQIFGTGGTLTVTEGLTLTAVYSSSYVKVQFDLNAESAWWEGGQVPADPEDAYVAPNSTVPRPASQNYTANAYTLVGWSLDPDGGTLWNFSSRLSAQTDERDTITLYGVWTERSAAVRFDLGGGTMVSTLPDSGLADCSALTPAIADPSYNDSGLVRALTVRGVKFGDKLDKYSVTMALTKDGEEVTFALVDLPKLITKGEMYTCSGLFANEDRNEDWLANPVNAANVTVYTSWQLAGGDPDDEYYLATYNYTLKADNTYAITARDREALVLYIPETHPDGKPVTEIADGAFSGMSEVTKVDFSAAANLTEIGSSAFYACTALGEVVGDENLTKLAKVGSDAFYGTAWMNGKSSGEGDVTIGNVLVRYMGKDTETEKIDLSGTGYKYIAEYALSGYKNVTTIVLPSTIVRIDDNTLGIASLEKVEIEAANIKYIGRKAFESSVMISGQSGHIVIGNVFYLADNATAAANGGVVTIPTGVTVIAPGAFAQCTAVKELKFEDGEGEDKIDYVGARAFNGSGIEAADEDGFIIVNGILARYTGSAETVVVPDEVRVVAPYAFGKGVKNVVFRSTSSLERIENNAFTGASALETVAVYKDSGTFTAAPYAFADGSGCDAATASVKVYLTTALYDGMDTEVGALAWLNANGRVEESVTEHVEINADVFVHDYVASDEDGTFDQYDFAAAWGDTDIADDFESAVVPDGISVTRDGITVAEDYVITLDTVLTGLRNAAIASGRPHEASGTLELKYGDNYTFELDYVIHAAIDGSTLELDDTYLRDGDRLLMYNTQSAFNTLGSMTFGYKTLKVGDKTGQAGAADAGSVPLNSSAVSVIGYQPTVGEYSGDNALKIVYNYYGREYTKTYDYVVRTPRVMGLQQVSAAVMPLGSSAADYNTDITFNVIYEDGRTVLRDLRSATVITVDGVNASALSTAEAGVHTAEIRYSETGSIPRTGTIVYAVELVAIDGLYTFSYNDADMTATITGVTSQRDFYVLPSETVNPENDFTYQVVAIGDRAFAGSRLSKIYIPRGITVIGDGAFSGCANLTQVLGFEYNDDAANDSSLAFGDFRILTEEREGTASIAITDINDYALSEDVITIPHLGVYSGVISDFSSGVQDTLYENAVVTANYELVFTLDADIATAIAEKLADYVGTVRLPATAGADGALAVVEGFEDLYTKLEEKGLTLELYADTPFGIEELYGRVTVAAEALATVDYTAKGTVIFTGALSGDIAYIPATVKNGENREYTVTALAEGTLLGVANADAIYIPASVVTFEGGLEGVFGGTYSADIYMYDAGADLVRPHSSAAGTAKLPAGIEEIGNQAFMNCSLLDMDFYDALNLKTIGSEAFAGCTTLDKVCFGTGAQLTYIGYGAFMDSGVAEVDLGSTKVEEIEASAFDSCRSLGRLVLPAGTLKVIGARAFYGCTGLVDGTVSFVGSGSYITYIGESAFYGCTFSPEIVRGHEAADCHEADDAFYDEAGNAFEGI